MNWFMHAEKNKLLLFGMVAAFMLFSFASFGQSLQAAEGVSELGSASSSTDASKLADGTYYIDYTILYAKEDKTSMSAQYLVSPALLKVKDGKKTVSFTVLQSKEIVGLKLNGSEGIVSNEEPEQNRRVVTFELDDLSAIHPAWISINWVIEAINFKYINEYDIRFQFLPETIEAVDAAAAVPTKAGNVGFPSGYDDDNGAAEEEAAGEEPGEEQTAAGSFADVEGHWAKSAISRAVEQGIASGYHDGTFKPNAVISRAEFAVLISRALELPQAQSSSSFADQASIPDWASEHIKRAAAAKLISGYSDGTFRASSNISRAELAVVIARAAGLQLNEADALSFADKQLIPQWAQQEVAAAVKAGLISGTSDNKFEPAASATRAEALTLIMRLLDAKL
ncbi:S-layer homology domain-containing protein [Paenibacillus montaniterrae]|uniref:S-layer homology domain-containing protein n=1 Tax=Paenibacillus montaniterrae TaxID=429341 RepID=UPI001BD1B708|nr:S-layer homology domain-containing protein [Paenibacillus montaniterrae]